MNRGKEAIRERAVTQSQEDPAEALRALGLAERLRRVAGGEAMRFD
jgi:hypothetical protein